MGFMQSAWAIGALFAAAISSVVIERFGWRVLFLIGALPAVAAFIIRRNVEEPQVWRDRDGRPSRFSEMFGPTFLRRVIIAKQRNGPTGDFPLVFLPDHMTFASYSSTPLESF